MTTGILTPLDPLSHLTVCHEGRGGNGASLVREGTVTEAKTCGIAPTSVLRGDNNSPFRTHLVSSRFFPFHLGRLETVMNDDLDDCSGIPLPLLSLFFPFTLLRIPGFSRFLVLVPSFARCSTLRFLAILLLHDNSITVVKTIL